MLLTSRREGTVVRDGDAKIFIRIYRSIVNADFIVKMRTGRASASADVSDHIAAMHGLPRSHSKTGKVSKAGADAIAVIDHDHFALAHHILVPVPPLYLAVVTPPARQCNHRAAIAAANIYAAVECPLAVERI